MQTYQEFLQSRTGAAYFGVKALADSMKALGKEEILSQIKIAPPEEGSYGLKPEAFALAKDSHGLTLAGGDERGLLYGTLELEERLRAGAELSSLAGLRQEPFVKTRGIYTFLTTEIARKTGFTRKRTGTDNFPCWRETGSIPLTSCFPIRSITWSPYSLIYFRRKGIRRSSRKM